MKRVGIKAENDSKQKLFFNKCNQFVIVSQMHRDGFPVHLSLHNKTQFAYFFILPAIMTTPTVLLIICTVCIGTELYSKDEALC